MSDGPGFVLRASGVGRHFDDGQRITGIAMKMLRGGVITGAIRDHNGEPMQNVRLYVLRYTFGAQTGEKTLTQVSGGLGTGTGSVAPSMLNACRSMARSEREESVDSPPSRRAAYRPQAGTG